MWHGRQSLSHQAATSSGTEINKESSEKQPTLIKVVDVFGKKVMARPNLKSGYDLVPQSQSSGWVACLIQTRVAKAENSITNDVIPQFCNIVPTGVSPWTVWQASHPLCLLSSSWERRRRSAVHTTWQRMASWGRSAAVDCLSCSGAKNLYFCWYQLQ